MKSHKNITTLFLIVKMGIFFSASEKCHEGQLGLRRKCQGKWAYLVIKTPAY
jgi:hypothetical protein